MANRNEIVAIPARVRLERSTSGVRSHTGEMFQGLIRWLIAVLRSQHSKPALVIQLLTLVLVPVRAAPSITANITGPGVHNENHYKVHRELNEDGHVVSVARLFLKKIHAVLLTLLTVS